MKFTRTADQANVEGFYGSYPVSNFPIGGNVHPTSDTGSAAAWVADRQPPRDLGGGGAGYPGGLAAVTTKAGQRICPAGQVTSGAGSDGRQTGDGRRRPAKSRTYFVLR